MAILGSNSEFRWHVNHMKKETGQFPLSASANADLLARLVGIIRPEEQKRLFTVIGLIIFGIAGLSKGGEIGNLISLSSLVIFAIILGSDILRSWIKGDARTETRIVTTSDYSLIEGSITEPEKLALELRRGLQGQRPLPLPDGEVTGNVCDKHNIREYSNDEKQNVGQTIQLEATRHDLEVIRSLNSTKSIETEDPPVEMQSPI